MPNIKDFNNLLSKVNPTSGISEAGLIKMLEKVVQPPNINIQQSQAPPYSQYSQPGSPVTVSAPPFTVNFQGTRTTSNIYTTFHI